jgi:CHAT domain-containing protein
MQRPAAALGDSGAAGDATTFAGVRGALTSSEVLLDCFVGPDTSWVFTVTRDACRVSALPGEKALEPRVRLLVDFLASPPAAARSNEVADQAARAIAAPLLAGIEGKAAVSHVLFAPDGVLRRLPLQLLGRAAGSLAGDFDVTVVPSATILVDLRHRTDAGPSARRSGLVVLEGPFTEAGARFDGVEREVRELRGGYAGVAVLADSVARSPELWTRSRPQVIHVAAHSVVDDERPWRSGIRLAAASREADPYVRAETISATRAPASLVVLSSCSSAGGESLTGEGVEGLASAFLTGGAEAVVATLWPVEDRAAAQIMHEFYRELALGKPVAGALRGAQEAMRRDRTWSDPFFWSGYVVLGNGAVQIPLRTRPWAIRGAPWILGTALLLLAVPAILRRRATSA